MFSEQRFTLREINNAEAAQRWNNRNTHEFLNINPRLLRGSRSFVCDNNACEGLYFLDNENEQPQYCVYCALPK